MEREKRARRNDIGKVLREEMLEHRKGGLY